MPRRFTSEKGPATCLVCGQPAFFIGQANHHPLAKCTACLLEFCHPMPTEQELATFYSDYRDIRAAPEVTAANALRNIRRLSEYGLSADQRLLDYGSGGAAFCRVANSPHWFSYDPYTDDNDQSLLRQSYDWITLWAVLEHVTDPVHLLKNLRMKLATNGHLALTTVTIEADIPCRRKPPEHLTCWTKAALAAACKKAAFRILACEPYIMRQKSDVYMSIMLRTMPEEYRKAVHHQLPDMVTIPTNEVLLVARAQ